MPAAVQRNAIAAFRHRFTLRQTRRTVPIMSSIELVQASERQSFAGKPRVDLDDQEVQLGQGPTLPARPAVLPTVPRTGARPLSSGAIPGNN